MQTRITPSRKPAGPGGARLALMASVGLAAAGAGPARAEAPAALVLYAAQHEQMVDQLAKSFTAQTGIPVKIRTGEAPELAAQIIREGDASPADVFFTENSPELTLLDEKHLLEQLPPSILDPVPARYSAADGDWVGVLARENVLAYDPKLIAQDALPKSLMDLAKPEWKGKVAIAPTDADFLPLVQAVTVLKGRDATLAWLRGLRVNAKIYDDDEGVVAAVERGAVPTGIINSYYWARLRTEFGPDKTTSRIYHFRGQDPGGLINVSGAAILRMSKHKKEAERFVAFLVEPKTQTALGTDHIDFEYPLVSPARPDPLLTPMAELEPPSVDMKALGDDRAAAGLLREAGLL